MFFMTSNKLNREVCFSGNRHVTCTYCFLDNVHSDLSLKQEFILYSICNNIYFKFCWISNQTHIACWTTYISDYFMFVVTFLIRIDQESVNNGCKDDIGCNSVLLPVSIVDDTVLLSILIQRFLSPNVTFQYQNCVLYENVSYWIWKSLPNQFIFNHRNSL